MSTFIEQPARIEQAGNLPKIIDEYIGRINSGNEELSIAHMIGPAGWTEPVQTPEFDEYTLVLKGRLIVEHDGKTVEVGPGQAIVAHRGERIRYSVPGPEEAEYVAVCIPAFCPDLAHRDPSG